MMDLSRWQEIKNLLLEALELPEEKRSSYLDAACGSDANLRQEVEALIVVSSTRADSLDDLQLVPESLKEANFTEGEVVGPYRIIRLVGKGGMGAVYLAEDVEHGRNVALKTMSRSTKSLLQEEKRLLARLQHPNIATLYDSGQTKRGSGYFIMEYVEGESITDYCESHGLSLRERLELFLVVCNAVAFAHRNLIVHRDIKPSNILVTKDGVPKLLDFGIAKLIPSAPSLQPEIIAFTKPFASPEQLRGEQTTTATDVYSLGVLLCLLLTGRLPYPAREDSSWTTSSMKPEKPSDLTLKEVIGIGTDTRKRSRQLRGDLDAIVLRTLRKDANERYHSVQELAADIQRFLNYEPVSARDQGTVYRAYKFIRRHRTPVILSILALVASISVSVWLFVMFREARYQRNQARLHQQRSEAIKDFMVRSFDLSSPFSTEASNPTVRDLLSKATSEAETTLKHQPEQQVAVLALLAHIYKDLGLDKSRQIAELAVERGTSQLPELSPGLADALYSLSSVEIGAGNYARAEELLRRSLSIRRQTLGEDHPDYAASMHSLGISLYHQGKIAEAENCYRRALSLQRTRVPRDAHAVVRSLTALALLLERGRQSFDEAEHLYREALDIARKDLGPNHPTLANILDPWAQLLTNAGRFEEAEERHLEALAITRSSLGEDHPDIVPRLYNLAFLYAFRNKNDQAETLFRQALERSHSILGPDHVYTLSIEANLGRFIAKQENYDEALRLLSHAESRAVSVLGLGHRTAVSFKRQKAHVLLKSGDAETAEKEIRTVIDLLIKDPTSDPLEVAVAKSLLGDCLIARRQFDEAEPLAVAWYEIAPPREKPNALQTLVDLYSQWGKPQKVAEYRKILTDVTLKTKVQ